MQWRRLKAWEAATRSQRTRSGSTRAAPPPATMQVRPTAVGHRFQGLDVAPGSSSAGHGLVTFRRKNEIDGLVPTGVARGGPWHRAAVSTHA
jgi:hypothetical protein